MVAHDLANLRPFCAACAEGGGVVTGTRRDQSPDDSSSSITAGTYILPCQLGLAQCIFVVLAADRRQHKKVPLICPKIQESYMKCTLQM